MALAADESERRLVSEVILDARLGHARAVKLGGEGVADAGDGLVRRRAAGSYRRWMATVTVGMPCRFSLR